MWFLFCRTTNEHVTAERDKLLVDVTDHHNRITVLVKEGDERHGTLERNKEREIA